mmetsp:Transcript_41039/g.49325  ORF Transcript_41039/g.49325 Transcript_41039/m.49325 type:complete len:300 (+) Transcript_41039:122-1021(+)
MMYRFDLKTENGYFHKRCILILESVSFFITLLTAISKSSWVTCTRRSLNANIPASVQTALHSAPLALGIFSAILFNSIPRNRFIFREWMLIMLTRLAVFGLGNSIFRSIRPGLKSAASRISIRLVAMTTLMFCAGSNPSSWLRSSSMVRCTSESPPDPPPSPRLEPMESISSIKMMEGAASRAMTNNSRTIRLPSPIYFCTNSAPLTRMKVQSVWCATARASSVFPVPGGPYRSTPLGCATPNESNNSGCLIGNSITSLISITCFSNPPIISYVLSGTASTFIRLTSGSTFVGKILWSV